MAIKLLKAGADFPPENDNIKTPEKLAQEINALHQECEGAEQVSLLLAWEIGVRLNLAYEMIRKSKWGLWGKYLDEYCPDISRMTVWRYRELARHFNSVLQFDGMTLSQAYADMKLAKFKEDSDDGSADVPGAKKEKDSFTVKLFKDIAKLSKKFDIPVTLSSGEANTLQKGALKIVAVLEERKKGTAKVVEVEAVNTSGEEGE